MIVVIPFFILFLLELITDLRRGAHVLRMPAFWAKLGLFLFTVRTKSI